MEEGEIFMEERRERCGDWREDRREVEAHGIGLDDGDQPSISILCFSLFRGLNLEGYCPFFSLSKRPLLWNNVG